MGQCFAPADQKSAVGLQSLISPVATGVILGNPDKRAGDFADAVHAIVLCADLSGFSIGGATLTRSETRGAEELRSIVTAVFGQVTDAIRATGGQILQFSGDAVTAAWPISGGLAAQTLCAVTAGLALQDACRKLSVPGMAELKMRVGLAQGQVWIAHLHAARSEPETVMCGDVFGRVGAIGKGREGVFLDQSLWDQISAAVALGAAVSVTADRAGLWVTSLGRTLAQPGPAPVRTLADAAIIARYVPDWENRDWRAICNPV